MVSQSVSQSDRQTGTHTHTHTELVGGVVKEGKERESLRGPCCRAGNATRCIHTYVPMLLRVSPSMAHIHIHTHIHTHTVLASKLAHQK